MCDNNRGEKPFERKNQKLKITVESRIDLRLRGSIRDGYMEWRDWSSRPARQRSRLTMFRERNNVIDFQRGNVPEPGTEERNRGLGLCPTRVPHHRLVDESKFVIDVWTGTAMPASHNSSTSFPISTTDRTWRVANLSFLDSFVFLLFQFFEKHNSLWSCLLSCIRSFGKNFSTQ